MSIGAELRDDFLSLMSEPLDRSVVGIIIRRSLPEGLVTYIEPIVGEGVSNDTQLFHFGYDNGCHHDLVIKIGRDIGTKERLGRQLLSGHFTLPTTYGHDQEHVFIYDYVPGDSVNALVAQDHPKALEHFRRFLRLNLALWQQTLKPAQLALLAGYPQKVESTLEVVFRQQVNGRAVAEIMEFPIVVNSTALPSLAACLQKATELISPNGTEVASALQHGDEGASNAIVRRADNQQFIIDNGVVGRRILEEGIAKLIMWWAITAHFHSFELKSSSLITFNYQLAIPGHISRLVKSAIAETLEVLGDKINPERLSACVGVYLLRELQWTKKRNAGLNGVLIAMALEAFSGMFSGKPCFPGFSVP